MELEHDIRIMAWPSSGTDLNVIETTLWHNIIESSTRGQITIWNLSIPQYRKLLINVIKAKSDVATY